VNRIEDRLRDAFAAAAGTVQSETVRGLPDRPVVPRTRRIAPLAAAAAVAAVVIGASVITPLVLASGHHSGPSSSTAGVPSPAASPSSSGATLVVPDVIGMPVSRAGATLQAVGLRVTQWPGAASSVPAGTVLTQDPAAGTHVPASAIVTLTISSGSSVTITLQPGQLVTVSAYAATIRIPQDWQPTPGLRSGVGYSGTSGWVQLQAVTEPVGLRAACSAVMAQNASQYGRHPYISYENIDGRPGCQTVPDLPTGGTPVPPMTAALVEYRTPLSDGANFLLISADPATMYAVVASIQVDH
jgi:hypothetical protein